MSFNGKKILAIIPAREGSKRVPGKNIRYIGGKPLIWHTLQAATDCKYIDAIVVSSDSLEILNISQYFHKIKTILRPIKLAQDSSTSVDVAVHALEQYSGYDYFILLQPTSPFRTAANIIIGIETLFKSNAKLCISTRYDYEINADGAFYMADTNWFKDHKTFSHPNAARYEIGGWNSLDINTEDDIRTSDRHAIELQCRESRAKAFEWAADHIDGEYPESKAAVADFLEMAREARDPIPLIHVPPRDAM